MMEASRLSRMVTIVTLILVLSAGQVNGEAPLDGVYTSTGGDLLRGRFSESWVGGMRDEVGNTVHAESWNGVALGSQWEVSCATIAAPPVLIEDRVDENGNGHRTYHALYGGGRFRLAGSGPWGNGDAFYGGEIAHYSHTTTYQYRGSELTSSVVNVQFAGHFDGYPQCMQVTIANAVGLGWGEQLRAYPMFLDGGAGCEEDASMAGEWGDIHSMTLVIRNCSTPTEHASWGTLKNLYR